MAGVYINYIPAGDFWFIQESGKTTCQFRGNNGGGTNFGSNISGTAAIGAGVYLAAISSANANNTVGLFDQLAGATFAATGNNAATIPYTTIDNMFVRYVGPAETLPSNGNMSLVDICLSRASFRW